MKKIAIFTSSPNQDGLTAACGKAAKKGIESAGIEVNYIRLNDLDLKKCRACDRGWGQCRDIHKCIIEDDFTKIQEQIQNIEACILITPVYYGEMSESAKTFFDRLRRCEATKDQKSFIQDKLIMGVAAAGGSGGGTLNCLSAIKNLFNHMGAKKHDLIGITQRNREYKIDTIRKAAEKLAEKINH